MRKREESLSNQTGHGFRLFIDGASRGNPGMAAAGVYITDLEGNRIAALGRYLGHKTNNEAEYGALLLGLQQAKRLGARALHIYTDSELVERQVNGRYRVKEPRLKLLHQKVMECLKAFSSFEIESISRDENQEADLLANQAIEREIHREKEGVGRGRDGRSSGAPERGGLGGGKSELLRAGWSVTRTVLSPKGQNTESATENKPSRLWRDKGEKAR